MATRKILPGELFIVEYVNGVFENRWAFNASNDYIELEPGRLAQDGVIDVLVEPTDPNGRIVDSRYHVVSNSAAIRYVVEDPYYTFNFILLKFH